MKKLILCLSLLISLVVSGCNCSLGKYELSSKFYNNNTGFIDLKSKEEFQEKLDNKESFIVFIHSITCQGCIAFTPILEEFMKNESIAIYRLTIGIFSTFDDLYDYQGTPSLVFFKEGKKVAYSSPTSEDDGYLYKNVENLTKYISKKVKLEVQNG